jgi:hypothetical protein
MPPVRNFPSQQQAPLHQQPQIQAPMQAPIQGQSNYYPVQRSAQPTHQGSLFNVYLLFFSPSSSLINFWLILFSTLLSKVFILIVHAFFLFFLVAFFSS